MRASRVSFLLVLVWISLLACSREPEADPRARAPIAVAGAAHDPADAERPRLRFPDGTRTANDRCMVLQRKLNPHIPPSFVNGTPVGFC